MARPTQLAVLQLHLAHQVVNFHPSNPEVSTSLDTDDQNHTAARSDSSTAALSTTVGVLMSCLVLFQESCCRELLMEAQGGTSVAAAAALAAAASGIGTLRSHVRPVVCCTFCAGV